jgi:hypothetical protein
VDNTFTLCSGIISHNSECFVGLFLVVFGDIDWTELSRMLRQMAATYDTGVGPPGLDTVKLV